MDGQSNFFWCSIGMQSHLKHVNIILNMFTLFYVSYSYTAMQLELHTCSSFSKPGDKVIVS